jgi:hypothetical protein
LKASGNPNWNPDDVITSAKLNNIEGALKAVESLGALPAPGNAGRVVRLTTDGKIYVDNGTAFEALAKDFGYVPANKAGETFTGNVTLANNIAVIGTKTDASTFTALRPNAANGLDVGSTVIPLNLYSSVDPTITKASTTYTFWHSGNFDPATKLNLAGGVMTGGLTLTNGIALTGRKVDNTALNLAYVNAADNILVGDSRRPIYLVGSVDPQYYNGTTYNTFWHAGNFNPATKANLSGATFTGSVNIDAGGQELNLKPGTQDFAYMGFYARTASPTTRSGWFGFGGAGITTLTLANEFANASINISTNGTGIVQINGNQIWHAGNFTPATKLDIAGGTLTGPLTLNADPSSSLHAATKAYVDAVAQGFDPKASVRVATTANIVLSGTQTIDDIAVIVGNRVLVKDQTTASQNGIYVVAAGAWTRATDADTGTKVTSGMYAFVEEGTNNHTSGWTLLTVNPITVGTTSLVFTQSTGAGQIINGDGILKSGNTISIDFGIASTQAAPGNHTHTAAAVGAVPTTDKGAVNGVATLDGSIKVPVAQLPTGTGFSQVAIGNHTHTAFDVGALPSGGGTMTGYITANADPNQPLHVATKAYVDSVTQVSDPKASVRAASTANIASLVGPQTVDGVALVSGDRVLLKDQTTASQNGIYKVNPGGWSRGFDADTSAKVTPGMFTFVEEGTVNHGNYWTLITPNPITLGTTSLTFIISAVPTTGGTMTGGLTVPNLIVNGAKYWGKLAADPASTNPGDFYYNTVQNVFLFYNGTSWGGFGMTQAQVDARVLIGALRIGGA